MRRAISLAAFFLLAANPLAAAAEETHELVIELGRKATFTAIDGSAVDIDAGTYALLAIPEGIRVTRREGEPFDLSAELDTHDLSLTVPVAIVDEPDDDDAHPDAPVLAVFLESGLAHRATGSYSGILSRAASDTGEPSDVEIAFPTRFDAADGEELLVEPGTYTLRVEGDLLELVDTDGTAYALDGERDSLDEAPDVTLALSLAGTDEDANHHFLVLLDADGTRWRAAGDVELVTERGKKKGGVFGGISKAVKKTTKDVKKKAKKVKKTAKKATKTVKKATKTASKVGNRTLRNPGAIDKSAKDIGKLGYQTGKTAVKTGVKHAKQQAMEVKKRVEALAELTCMAGIEALEATMKVQDKLLGKFAGQLMKQVKTAKVQKEAMALVDRTLGQFGTGLAQAFIATGKLSRPTSLKKLTKYTKSSSVCSGKLGEASKAMESIAGKELKSSAEAFRKAGRRIIPRAGGDWAFTLAGGGGGGAGMGGELAFRWATNFGTSSDFKAPNAGFFDIAYMIKLGAGGGGGIILGIFPFSHPTDTGGDFVSIEVSGGHPKAPGGFGAGIELVFSVPKGQHKMDMSKWKFEGVQLPTGGGASPLPGEINFKVGTGIQLGG